jgi:hypothetical protein
MPDVVRTLDLPPGQRFEYWKHTARRTARLTKVAPAGGALGLSGPGSLQPAVQGHLRHGPRDYRASHALAIPDRRS